MTIMTELMVTPHSVSSKVLAYLLLLQIYRHAEVPETQAVRDERENGSAPKVLPTFQPRDYRPIMIMTSWQLTIFYFCGCRELM